MQGLSGKQILTGSVASMDPYADFTQPKDKHIGIQLDHWTISYYL